KALHKWSDRAAFAACALKIYGLRAAALKLEIATMREAAKAAKPKPSQAAQSMSPATPPAPPSPPLDAGARPNAGAAPPPSATAAPASRAPDQPLRPSRMPRPGPNDVTLADIAAASPR